MDVYNAYRVLLKRVPEELKHSVLAVAAEDPEVSVELYALLLAAAFPDTVQVII